MSKKRIKSVEHTATNTSDEVFENAEIESVVSDATEVEEVVPDNYDTEEVVSDVSETEEVSAPEVEDYTPTGQIIIGESLPMRPRPIGGTQTFEASPHDYIKRENRGTVLCTGR